MVKLDIRYLHCVSQTLVQASTWEMDCGLGHLTELHLIQTHLKLAHVKKKKKKCWKFTVAVQMPVVKSSVRALDTLLFVNHKHLEDG